MQVLRIFAAVALAIGLVSATPALETRRLAGGNEACGSARVRKPWDGLTKDEQSLYVEALGLAVKSGVVKDLAAIHLESMSETQAHRSCAFFAWHRRMLLAFEAYLRDLGPKYACITIPYYDVHSAYVKAANNECTNMFDCSPIFEAIGGATKLEELMQLKYNNETIEGFPMTAAPFVEDCDDDNAHCGAMLRGYLKNETVPSSAGFSSFLSIVTRSPDYATFLEGIQFGLHNEIHGVVAGVMGTFASPRDVFFYSWHSAIDMYLAVFHQCHVGSGFSATQSNQTFTLATQTCGGVSGIDADSNIIMRFKKDGEWADATEHPLLGKYFQRLGGKMANFADTGSLGDYSYTYEFPTIMKTQILSNKDVCQCARETAKQSDDTIETPAQLVPGPATGSTNTGANGSSIVAPHSGIVIVTDPKAPPSTAASGNASSVIIKPTVATTGSYWEWVKTTYDGLVERFDGDMKVVTEQMRVIECLAFDKVFGVTEFSENFAKTFHLASTKHVCGKKIDAVTCGNVTVAIAAPSAAFKAAEVTFAAPAVIEVVKQEAIKTAAAPKLATPQINAESMKMAEMTLQDSKKTDLRPETSNDADKKTATNGATTPQINTPAVAKAGEKPLAKETVAPVLQGGAAVTPQLNATTVVKADATTPEGAASTVAAADAGKKKRKKHRVCK